MKNKILTAGILVIAGAAFWMNERSRDHTVEDATLLRCELITRTLDALQSGQFRDVDGFADVEMFLESRERIQIFPRGNTAKPACPDGPSLYWFNSEFEVMPSELDADTIPEAELPLFLFRHVAQGALHRSARLQLQFHCGQLCAQFWEVEFRRTRSGWELTDIYHTRSS